MKRFLIVSSGHVGSRYMTQILKSMGVATEFCKLRTPGVWDPAAVVHVSDWMSRHTDKFTGVGIMHQCRHPQYCVPGLVDFGFERIVRGVPLIDAYVTHYDDPVRTCWKYWIDVTDHLLNVENVLFRYQIETVEYEDFERVFAENGIHTKPVHIQWKEKRNPAVIPQEFEADVLRLIEQIGYQPIP